MPHRLTKRFLLGFFSHWINWIVSNENFCTIVKLLLALGKGYYIFYFPVRLMWFVLKRVQNKVLWSHDHREYTSPKLHDVSVNDLLPYFQMPLGMHHIPPKLYSLPLSYLHSLYTTCLKTSNTDPYSTLYKLTAIILNIGQHRLLKPVTIFGNEKENRPFLPLFFGNKCLDAINVGNILHHKSVKVMVPPCF